MCEFPSINQSVCNQVITLHILTAYSCIFLVCVCVCLCMCRRQSASCHPGAKLSFIKAVCAVWKPLYNQRCPFGLLGGTVYTNTYTLLPNTCERFRGLQGSAKRTHFVFNFVTFSELKAAKFLNKWSFVAMTQVILKKIVLSWFKNDDKSYHPFPLL